MRKIITEVHVSLDGFVDESMTPSNDADFVTHLEDIDTRFYGRRAYESLSHDGGVALSASQLIPRRNRVYVFTRKHMHVPGAAMVIRKNIRQEVTRIKSEVGSDIWLYGGAGLINSLSNLHLVDDYYFVIKPGMKKTGKRVFSHLDAFVCYDLIDLKILDSGTLIVHYRNNKRHG